MTIYFYDYKEYSLRRLEQIMRTVLANLAKVPFATDRYYVKVMEATVVDLSPLVMAYPTQQGISALEYAANLQRQGWSGTSLFWGLPGAVAMELKRTDHLHWLRFGTDRIVMYTARCGTMSWEQIMDHAQQPLEEKEI